jgi:hypothetical protein
VPVKYRQWGEGLEHEAVSVVRAAWQFSLHDGGGAVSRVAMSLMRHSGRRLTDKIYADENLLGTWAAFDTLPNYAEPHKF